MVYFFSRVISGIMCLFRKTLDLLPLKWMECVANDIFFCTAVEVSSPAEVFSIVCQASFYAMLHPLASVANAANGILESILTMGSKSLFIHIISSFPPMSSHSAAPINFRRIAQILAPHFVQYDETPLRRAAALCDSGKHNPLYATPHRDTPYTTAGDADHPTHITREPHPYFTPRQPPHPTRNTTFIHATPIPVMPSQPRHAFPPHRTC